MPTGPSAPAATAAALPPVRRSRVASWQVGVLVSVATATALVLAYQARPLLYDTDAYYHLAVARIVAASGFPDDLTPLRASAMGAGFGDKEPLFHLLLAPLVGALPPLLAGKVALALLDGLVLGILAWLGHRAVGWWGLVAPAWVALGSLEVAWRLVRLRPELLSLAVLLLALAAAGHGRYRLVGGLAAVYALSYTAWHAFVGVFWLLFLFRGWARRRWEWPLLAYPLLGACSGLLANPGFPANLLIWKLVAWDFFRHKAELDVGTEIRPNLTQVTLLANLGWWAVAGVLWRAAERRRPAGGEPAVVPAGARPGDVADAFGVAAMAFGLLYLLMSRFSLYAFSFGAVWLLWELARRDAVVGPRVRLPFRGAVPTAAALTLAALLGAPGLAQEVARFVARTDAGPRGERLADYEAFGRALPAGARVAATWDDTPIYLLWAPQGSYLNALDPVLMAAPYPVEHAAQRDVFAGEEPDVPLTAAATLDSGFVAWSLPGAPPRLLDRLAADPRARPLHRGIQALFALRPAPPGTFLLDWRVAPPGARPGSFTAGQVAAWPSYPRHPAPRGRAMEGYVDARRVASRGCVLLASPRPPPPGELELAASGPTRLWAGGTPVVAVGGEPGAVLGEGVRLRAGATAGPLTVLTCPDRRGRAGFYLLRR